MSRLSRALIAGIRSYKYLVSPWLGNHCRFYPNCSSYGEEAIAKKGVFKGIALLVARLFKCHPLHPGGLDPVE